MHSNKYNESDKALWSSIWKSSSLPPQPLKQQENTIDSTLKTPFD